MRWAARGVLAAAVGQHGVFRWGELVDGPMLKYAQEAPGAERVTAVVDRPEAAADDAYGVSPGDGPARTQGESVRRTDRDGWLDLASDCLRDVSPVIDWAVVGRLLADQLHTPVAGDFVWAPQVPGVVAAYKPTITFDLSDVASRASNLHPLARHYARTRSTSVLAIDQVPGPATDAERAYVGELTAHGIDQHLWIPVPPDGRGLHVCGACRARDPFTVEEVDDAVSVQRLLSAIVAHARVVQQWRDRLLAATEDLPWDAPGSTSVGDGVALTPRECAVLDLCARGLTSQAIARRLRVSPRTVEKHLENAYRKLGVRERVSAVRRARIVGAIGAPESLRASR
ncbi:helix-turn-helix transcriptional regulator [Cellulomonas fengjieae]|uniref:HTH luxR-type domain-containing protein n=1 Tax=Cellulomonas fengjieae TaxID=2819978 RepID=A0ABS3SG11_9CELL|nr:helix-turn-helix transcriptional regulator [Cellulomonas fengjieae]MBO3084690.1 hypothetical protein [Cellulomonas fengjieae]QVI66987.1 hypothetical protein KG102_05205 [Cellulomonas fengjieae]